MNTAETHTTPETGVAEDIRVVAGNPTPAELAAVIAVIEGVAAEQLEGARRHRPSRPDAWSVSQRAVRTPIVPGVTRWRTLH